MGKSIKKILTILVVGVLIVVFLIYMRSHKKEQAYREAKVITTNVHKTINVDATMNPDIYADISSELPTLIASVSVAVNDEVKKGQELFRLDKKSIRAQIANAKLTVERAELAERKARRKWDMLKPEERKSTIKATEQARQNLNEVYAQASKTTITSPIGGIVIEQNAHVGEVAQGRVMRIINPESLQVEALIPEVDIAKVAKGDKAFITFDAYPGKIVEGTFMSMDAGSTLKQNSTYFKAKIDIKDKKSITLLDGMNASVDIEIEKKLGVKAVPRDFAMKDDQGYFVYALSNKTNDKNQFIKKYFKEGIIGDEFVEIVSGLSVGELIVLPEDN